MGARPGAKSSLVAAMPPAGLDSRPGSEMVWIPGGTFLMGSDDHYPEEAPAHPVTVGGFWIDRHTVTNAEFARFVHKTGHLTVAEQAPDPADYPGAQPALLVPASTVFRPPDHRVDLGNHYNWWSYVTGANWRHPKDQPARSRNGLTIRLSTSPGPTCRPMRGRRRWVRSRPTATAWST